MKRLNSISHGGLALFFAVLSLMFIGCDKDEKSEGTVLILDPGPEESGEPSNAGSTGIGGDEESGMMNSGGDTMGGEAGPQGGTAGSEVGMAGMEGMGGELGMAGMDGVGGEPGGGPAPADCNETEYQAQRQDLSEDEDGVIRYLAFNTNPDARNPVTDVMLIEFHPDRGFPQETGTYDLAEVGADLNSCQICVLSFQDLDVRNGNRRMNLLATEGQIDIVHWPEIGEELEATLNGVVFKQVNITRNQLQQLVHEEVPNGVTL